MFTLYFSSIDASTKITPFLHTLPHRMNMQTKFLHFEFIGQIINFTFQCVGKQKRRFDFSFTKTCGQTSLVATSISGAHVDELSALIRTYLEAIYCV